jgi:hypothetical protein
MQCRATVITSAGERIALPARFSSRSDAEHQVDLLYPNARLVVLIIERRPS